MLLDTAVCCRAGSRNHNEDDYYFNGQIKPNDLVKGVLVSSARVDTAAALYGVCDGMGGMSVGEIASRLCADTLRAGAEEILAAPEASKVLKRWMKRMHRAVLCQAEENGRRMGAAAVIALVKRDEVTVCNAGDCRAYLLHDGAFRQLSQDDTLEQDLREVIPFPYCSGSLTQYLGMDEDEFPFEPHIFRCPFPSGARLLLCSDGVSKCWIESDLKTQLSTGSAQEAVGNLATGTSGETDDITALVVIRI